MAKKDGELSSWLIVGGLFTLVLAAVDIWYSSFGLMSLWLRIPLFIAHAAVIGLWVAEMIHFNDPNYDLLRRIVVILSFILSLTVGIHHATSVEDKQVIIDSKENKVKDSIKQQRLKDSLIKEQRHEYIHDSIIIIGDSKAK